jgi:hypothetical protein
LSCISISSCWVASLGICNAFRIVCLACLHCTSFSVKISFFSSFFLPQAAAVGGLKSPDPATRTPEGGVCVSYCMVGLVVPWNALGWVGSSILTSASLRSTLETGILSPRSGPEIFSTEAAAWAHWSGGWRGRSTNLWHNMALFTKNNAVLRAVPLGNTHINGSRRRGTRDPAPQPDSALKTRSQEWNFGGSRTCGAQVLPAPKNSHRPTPTQNGPTSSGGGSWQ